MYVAGSRMERSCTRHPKSVLLVQIAWKEPLRMYQGAELRGVGGGVYGKRASEVHVLARRGRYGRVMSTRGRQWEKWLIADGKRSGVKDAMWKRKDGRGKRN